ncbi:hypothetical protein CfE428DRAFT_4860 [Chthoniobacter flavus Ellin428]|uniref:Uncharacterized protein n=1 Tax=Chthoniobacter flavus Ellin428 TaxID=497964 RepID=B4D7E5_9BACT|nr:hypothetical protein CfE428DRAFT_4860 [Chthoniobacter flavus Ellin428]
MGKRIITMTNTKVMGMITIIVTRETIIIPMATAITTTRRRTTPSPSP